MFTPRQLDAGHIIQPYAVNIFLSAFQLFQALHLTPPGGTYSLSDL